MNTQYEKDTKLIIELINGKVYEGSFCFGDESRVTITNVSEYPSKKKYDTLYNFYKIEIASITVLEDSSETEKKPDTSQLKTWIEESEYERLKNLSHEYIYVAVVDNNFVTAIKYLKSCSEIAVFGFGGCFGRNSKITLLTVTTHQQIYIFDIMLSGERAFQMGLREILQSKTILKVVHNSKILADCLLHVYNVTLENVFDTQVADYMLLEMKQGTFPLKMREFAECVHFYLNMPATIIENAEISQKQLMDRPLSDDNKLNAALQAAYLYILKDFLHRKMLQNFNLTVNCYMNSMRNEDGTKAISMLKHDVPDVIKNLDLKL